MKKKWFAAGALLIIIVFVIFGVSMNSQRADSTVNEMEITTLQDQEISETVIVPGNLRLSDEQTVYYQSDKGEVEEVLVNEGDTVNKGDVLISYRSEALLNEQKQNQLLINRNYLELENIQKQRREIDKKLEEDENNEELQTAQDDLEFQEQQKELEISQVLLEKDSIEQKLSDIDVKSNVEGTVVTVSEETLASSAQSDPKPIVRIGSMENMIVSGEISEYDTLKIKKDQSVKLTSDAMPEESWEGTISFISDLPEQSRSEDSGVSYVVEAKLDDEEIPLRPGFKMLMEVETDKKTVAALPLTAVKREAENDYVYVVEEGVAKREKVETGIATDEYMEILSGLEKETEVILNPEDVTDGMEVAVK